MDASVARTPTRRSDVAAPGGRTLTYAAGGDPDGFPVIALHGTPGCRLNRLPDDDAYLANGVWWVTYDRPGYGRSTRAPGRRVADVAADVAALADALGLDRFGVVGGSGGGPHALACAALLPDRVVRAKCAVGVAPFGPPGLGRDAWLGGMDPANIEEFSWVEAGPAVLEPELVRLAAQEVEAVADDPTAVLAAFELSESDRAALRHPDAMAAMRASTLEQCAEGIGGWADDDLAFLHPWGFDVGTITVPVLITYGRTDVLVPVAHGDWLAANVPGALVDVSDTAGHLPPDPRAAVAATVAWLRDGVVTA